MDPTSDRVRRAIRPGARPLHLGRGVRRRAVRRRRGRALYQRTGARRSARISARQAHRLADRLLQEQLSDGGWNCDAPRSQDRRSTRTVCVLEGLPEYETAKGPSASTSPALAFADRTIFLECRLFRSRSDLDRSSERLAARLRQCSPRGREMFVPLRAGNYDILWRLNYLRQGRCSHPTSASAEAIDLVREEARRDTGVWPLENPHPGPVHFEMEGRAGEPSRWNTLRALRVNRIGAGLPLCRRQVRAIRTGRDCGSLWRFHYPRLDEPELAAINVHSGSHVT